MRSKLNFFIVLGIVFSISQCTSQEYTTGIRVPHGNFILVLSDSLKNGLNELRVESTNESVVLEVFDNASPVSILKNENTFFFPYSSESTKEIKLNGEVLSLPKSAKKGISLKTESDWIAVLSPIEGKYGFNPLVFAHFQLQNSTWKQVQNKAQFMPWMNMGNGYGHGSQFNVQAKTIDTLGVQLERGTVSFSMPGMWDLKFMIASDTLISPIYVTN